jgi:hypothetical protein
LLLFACEAHEQRRSSFSFGEIAETAVENDSRDELLLRAKTLVS